MLVNFLAGLFLAPGGGKFLACQKLCGRGDFRFLGGREGYRGVLHEVFPLHRGAFRLEMALISRAFSNGFGDRLYAAVVERHFQVLDERDFRREGLHEDSRRAGERRRGKSCRFQ